MQKLSFSVEIHAPREKVWSTMLNDETYRKWTNVFAEGSYAVTDWQEGSKALFLTPEGDGMVSTIVSNIPLKFLSIKHLGLVKNSIEDLDSEEAKAWGEAFENYSLEEHHGVTTLTVDMDIQESYVDYFQETWPLALQTIKALSETT